MNPFSEKNIGVVYKNKLLYAWFKSLHTRIDLLLYGKPETELQSVVISIVDNLEQLEKTANYFDSDSELSNVNQTAHLQPVSLSEDLFTMISLCLEYYQKTAGYFDITIHSENYQTNCIQSLILDTKKQEIFFDKPGIKIDLSGFLKGYALEKAREILLEYSLQNALVNFGNSSILALGNHPNGNGWKIKTTFPSNETNNDVILQNECFSTSGNENNARQHVISPYTKEYVKGEGRISITSKSGIDGEVLSTALFAATPEKRNEIIANFENVKYQTYI